ncbi:MAG: peptidase M50 [Candidatus Korarchaeota archaeon]|nr:peptidase M50 [Candidatus Korarchaeota archaeon]
MSSALYSVNRSEAAALGLALIAIAAAWIMPFPASPRHVARSIGVIVSAVLVHELAHRQVARRMGCYSRFVLVPMGFAITVVSAALPIKFLAPGYVGISCPYYAATRRAELWISASGPLTNLVMASAAALLEAVAYPALMVEAALLNAWLAFFNLLPLGPLDGAKVFRASPPTWLAMFTWAGFLLYAA